MKPFLALAAWLLISTLAPPALYKTRPVPSVPRIYLTAVPLSEEEPGRRAVGALLYLGGWSIQSNHPAFGGISALHVRGREVLALGDAGSVIRFSLPHQASAAAVDVRPIPDGPGSAERKADRDVESLAVAGGAVWLGFENWNAVWRYSVGDWRGEAGASPPAMRRWRRNKGAEAMVRLPDGRFLVFSEAHRLADGSSEVLLFDGDPAAGAKSLRFGYFPPEGYRITDAALLPDGRILYLNRKLGLDGFSAKLTLGRLPPLISGARLSGREIADLRRPLTTDNMEGLSVGRENGRTVVWIASDDNFSPLQRTLLLKFALAG